MESWRRAWRVGLAPGLSRAGLEALSAALLRNDPRLLQGATTSPPPSYNFAVMPRVETIDAFWEMKRRGLAPVQPTYEPIEAPRNSPIGVVTAFFASVTGFALIWHIWWMAILGLAGVFIAILAFGWSDDRERELSAAEIAQLERARLGLRQSA